MSVDTAISPPATGGSLDRILESLTLATLVAHLGVFATFWSRLPAVVPTHFDLAGAPDATGPRAWLLVFPVIAIATGVLLWIVAARPQWHNIPFDLTPANAGRVRGVSARMIRALNLYVNGLMLWALVATVRVALGQADGLGAAFLPVSLAAVAAIVGIGLVSMERAARRATPA